MLERLADWFYDPAVFWGAPLALVAVRAGLRRLRALLSPDRRVG